MIELALSYMLIASTAALATFVAARAWEYIPARLFVLVCVTLLLVRLFGDLRDRASDPVQAGAMASLSLTNIAILDVLLLLLFAALFAPSWYAGRRPMFWIATPYFLAALLLVADGLVGMHLIFTGISATPAGLRLQLAQPGGTLALVGFVLSWVPHLALLTVTFVRQPAVRVSIGILLATLIMAQIGGSLGTGGLMQALPVMFGLAHTVLRTRLLLPTRVGIEAAVRAMDDAVLVLNDQGSIAFANPAAMRAGMHEGTELATVKDAAASGYIQLRGRSLALQQNALTDRAGRPVGAVLIGRDVTELERRERLIDEERERLAEAVRRLKATQTERAELAAAMRQMALPVIPVLPGVLIMPLVGNFDGQRITDFTQTLLEGIEHKRARMVLLDITGLPLLDTAGAAGLLNGVRAAALLGARCVLVGVRPEIAQTIVGLGIDLDEIDTAATLQQVLQREVGR